MRVVLVLLTLLLGPLGQADEQPLKVLFGQSRPPFVMVEEQRGISLDLMREAFARLGLSWVPGFVSNQRMAVELRQGRADVAVEVLPDDPGLFYSQPFMVYHNYLVSRRADAIAFTGDWAELAGLRVCAWQDAEQGLGPLFVAARQGFAGYREYASQRQQVEHWLQGQCQVILIDLLVLQYHWRSLHEQNPQRFGGSLRDAQYQPLPQGRELWWHVGFRSQALRDRFDKELTRMRLDGSYERALRAYGIAE
jgi:polar amino acid transport system substrate-binding protein